MGRWANRQSRSTEALDCAGPEVARFNAEFEDGQRAGGRRAIQNLDRHH